MPDKPPPPGPPSPSGTFETGGDATLGGYVSLHHRPPAFQGSDGFPYTVSLEVEKTPNLLAPYAGYLVFPRWAETGVGIVGHLETPVLLEEASQARAEESLGRLTLIEVQDLLEAATQRHHHGTN
ncbi:MAG: hypothetical protein ACWGSQ_03145 [Longimicrobiales bacterium]